MIKKLALSLNVMVFCALVIGPVPTGSASSSEDWRTGCAQVLDQSLLLKIINVVRPALEFDRPEHMGGTYTLEEHLQQYDLFIFDCADHYLAKTSPIQNDRITVIGITIILKISRENFEIISEDRE